MKKERKKEKKKEKKKKKKRSKEMQTVRLPSPSVSMISNK